MNLFKGQRTGSCIFGLEAEYPKFDIGILTSRPSSPSSTLILVGRYRGRTEILSWEIDTEVWSTLRPSLIPPAEFHSLTLYQDTVYGLLSNGGVFMLQFKDLLESEDAAPRSLTFEQIRVQLLRH
ncbi:uncharacterized protein A4U43_UnF1250 [Asparagus officinalis]|uniref:Uncharacterized protein n=1 Tax=Asparagus officinalis TaxID=4686 RepID=A0A1R3L7K7_ASPOF|nr:uncharacterized protein A4U43_UnF1250 [Asparagus officinalis]